MSGVVGIDIGSRTAKGVLLNGNVIATALAPTGLDMQETADGILAELLNKSGYRRADITYIVGTGYGRVAMNFEGVPTKVLTEITCHGKGAHYLYPSARTIIDMGGQDCKAIRLDQDGNVVDFAMNDKCAAGTGRYLEVVANVFQVKLGDLGPLALKAEKSVPMSSTCTVFAETETISLLAQGEKQENIVHGIHKSIANRIAGMAGRVGIKSDVFFSGGVAKNIGMRTTLEEVFKTKLISPEPDRYDPQLTGALGAAVFAKNFAAKV